MATTLYVYLLEEGTDVWRPVSAEPVGEDHYRILSVNESRRDENWEFPTGSVVRAEYKNLTDGKTLVAVEAVEWEAQ